MNIFRLGLLLTALIAGSLAAADVDSVSGASPYAHGSPADRKAAAERLAARLTEELSLSIEQQAVLADIARDYGPQLAEITRDGLEVAWSVMDVARKNPQYGVDTEIAAQAAADAAARWVRTMAEMRNAVYSILTPQQIEQIETRMAERREAWQQRREAAEQQPAAPDDN